MTPLQKILQMKRDVDAAASIIAKITPPLDGVQKILDEIQTEADELGIQVVHSFHWSISEIDRIGGNAFPDPDEWVSSSANC